MELRQLSTFRMVATVMSFTAAAEALNYAQSSITAQIQALEDELGVPLFNQLGRRIVLTDAGERLLHYADKILKLTEEAHTVVSGGEEPSGTLMIGAPESICTYRLPLVLRQFQTSYPRVILSLRPMSYLELYRGVRDGVVDVAFMIDRPMQSTMLNVEILLREPLSMIAAPDHHLVKSDTVKPTDIEGEPILLTGRGCGYRNMFENALHEAGIHPATNMEFDSIEAIKQCVMSGLGIAVLPTMTVAKELASNQLAQLRWNQPNFAVNTQMLWHKNKWLSPALGAFLDICRKTFKGVEGAVESVA